VIPHGVDRDLTTGEASIGEPGTRVQT